ncbi:Yd1036cp-like RluD type 1 pseudouridine synthase [Cryptosporidium ryanae]|uniref:Yd1036cp-like RluD type 1 pseudouridine synthase n=1 Tax=Cryptosporidium ryanae TaxID=515981 RepID=UPI00351AA3C6|nr:Yd1036cp-like RluD type 1 pseudouridine synthase [Cryptosporidium ryanae]
MNIFDQFLSNFQTNIEIFRKDSLNIKVKVNEHTFHLNDEVTVVPPYMISCKSYCKQRWRGRSLKDLFSNEFRSRPISEYQYLVENGRLFINEIPVNSLDYIIRNGDYIQHKILFIELPVNTDRVTILYDTPDFLVVYKPYGIPCHPQGRYNKLSLTKIVQNEYLSKLDSVKNDESYQGYIHPINRLDRVTSGLVLLSKNQETTKILSKRISQAHKYYIAKIKANTFEFVQSIKSKNLKGVEVSELSKDESHGLFSHRIKCEIDIKVLKNRQGDCLMSSVDTSNNGKSALTYFYPITIDNGSKIFKKQKIQGDSGEYSLILCKPITGKTHQIRVHLQYIGFPIFQDFLYENNLNTKKTDQIGFKYFNSNYVANLDINFDQIDPEIKQSPLKEICFGGGGVLTFNQEKKIASVEYLIEPPLGICLHSLMYIIPRNSESEIDMVLRCNRFPKWVTDTNSSFDIEDFLSNWPIWNESYLEKYELVPEYIV